jgi:hypothetical protein
MVVAVAEPVTPEDLDRAIDAMVAALRTVAERDWHVPAGDLDWDCWETVEHVCDDLFAYAAQLGPKPPPLTGYVPFGHRARRPGGPDETIFADPAGGNDGVIQALQACGALLVAMVRTSPPQLRAYHPDGVCGPEGFAAMGIVEILVHMHDIAQGLGIEWNPPADLCGRVLDRLFPGAPADTDRWLTLLWATGRAELAGRARVGRWRWESAPR